MLIIFSQTSFIFSAIYFVGKRLSNMGFLIRKF